MRLEDLKIYDLAMQVGDKVWEAVEGWKYFEKDTIGKQLVRSADSIAANISEGYGRYHYKDSGRFYYISRGSLFETKTWITKSYSRNLIDKKNFEEIMKQLEQLGKMLNAYINTAKANMAKEPMAEYANKNEQEIPNS